MVDRVWKPNQEQDRAEAELASVIDELANQLFQGRSVNLPDFIYRHRQYEPEIRRLAPILQLLAKFWRQFEEAEDSNSRPL